MEVIDKTPYFSHPFTALVSGPSGCGKSTLIYKMLTNIPQCFDFVPSMICIAYSRNQSLYADIIKDCPIPVKLVVGLPKELKPPENALLIIDDLMNENTTISEWFTKNSHHYKISVLYLIQNLFLKSPEHRTTSLNAQFIILFSNPRDKTQITHLARQVNPTDVKFVIDAYRQATSVPHGYLVFNFKQSCPDTLRIRDSVFGDANVFYSLKTGVPLDLNSIASVVKL